MYNFFSTNQIATLLSGIVNKQSVFFCLNTCSAVGMQPRKRQFTTSTTAAADDV